MTTFKPLDIVDAKPLLAEPTTQLLDIRDEATYSQGHIPGAINLSREILEAFLQEQPKDGQYIICCYRGNSSKQVAQILCDHGFENVYNLEGGFTAWQEAANTQTGFDIELDA